MEATGDRYTKGECEAAYTKGVFVKVPPSTPRATNFTPLRIFRSIVTDSQRRSFIVFVGSIGLLTFLVSRFAADRDCPNQRLRPPLLTSQSLIATRLADWASCCH